MSDPLSISAGVVGLLSAGLQTAKGLIDYYDSFHFQDIAIETSLNKLRDLSSALQMLSKALNGRIFRSGEERLVESIESAIEREGEVIKRLELSLENCKGKPDGAAVRNFFRRSVYPLREKKLAELNKQVDALLEPIKMILQILGLRIESRIEGEVDGLKHHLHRLAVDKWMSAPDPYVDHYSAMNKRYPGTGIWFTEGKDYLTWLIEPNSFLWLYGFAGCGKSVLCSTIIQSTSERSDNENHTGIAFFYFTFSDNTKQNSVGMLKAILLQLSEQAGNDCTILGSLYQKYPDSPPPLVMLQLAFRALIQHFDNVYLFVDALDECPEGSLRDDVLEVISLMHSWGEEGLHLLATSRETTDISDMIGSIGRNVAVRNRAVDSDIENYVKGQFRTNQLLTKWSGFEHKICEALTNRAAGVFRWVDCQLASIRKCPKSERHLTQTLSSLPNTLAETYERMLENINSEFKEDAKRILTLLCFSGQPLAVAAMIDAVAVSIDGTPGLDLARRFQDENDLLQVCPGFIEVHERKSGTRNAAGRQKEIRLAHFSVQTFLESTRLHLQPDMSYFWLEPSAGHEEMAQILLVYLLNQELADCVAHSDILIKFPLAYYAANNWPRHYQLINRVSAKTFELACRLLNPNKNHLRTAFVLRDENYFVAYQDSNYGSAQHETQHYPVTSPLYFCASTGLLKLVPTFADQVSLNRIGGLDGIPLTVAARLGDYAMVKLLLDLGAQADLQDGDSGNTDVLSIADEHRSTRLFGNRSLYSVCHTGTTPKEVPPSYIFPSPLVTAANFGHIEIVRLLLDHGADVNRQIGVIRIPLQGAIRSCNPSVVRLLLEHGANPNLDIGPNAGCVLAQALKLRLWKADGSTDFEIVEVLLQNGAKMLPAGLRSLCRSFSLYHRVMWDFLISRDPRFPYGLADEILEAFSTQLVSLRENIRILENDGKPCTNLDSKQFAEQLHVLQDVKSSMEGLMDRLRKFAVLDPSVSSTHTESDGRLCQ